MKILVTGAVKGLGAYLSDALKCDTFTRNTHFHDIEYQYYDWIIHCAFNAKNVISQDQLASYIKDNLFLTRDLLNKVVSLRFIFISSVDVYPGDSELTEDTPIDINKVKNIYGQCKLICEELIKQHSNYLILRCGGIIGENKLPKSITGILSKGTTTLTETSTINYIAQKTILDIIQTDSVKNEIVNVVSDSSLMMKELESITSPITFGSYQYNIGDIKTDKLKKLFPQVKIPSSKETLMNVLNNL